MMKDAILVVNGFLSSVYNHMWFFAISTVSSLIKTQMEICYVELKEKNCQQLKVNEKQVSY